MCCKDDIVLVFENNIITNHSDVNPCKTHDRKRLRQIDAKAKMRTATYAFFFQDWSSRSKDG